MSDLVELVEFQKKEIWESLRDEVRIYELNLPPYSQIDSLTGKEEYWSPTRKKRESPYAYGRFGKVLIAEVKEVWTNPKGTVKVILAGKGRVSPVSKRCSVEGYSGLEYNSWRSFADIHSNIRKGSWVILNALEERNSSLPVCFISNEPKIEDIKEILESLDTISSLKRKYIFPFKKEDYLLKTYGTVSLKEVKDLKNRFFKSLRFYKWKKRKERWDLLNAVRKNLSYKRTKFLTVQFKGLDNNSYFLKAPVVPEKEKRIGWQSESIYSLDFWIPFVYRKDEHFKGLTQLEKAQQLLADFLKVLEILPEEELELGFNKRRIKITRKKTSNGSILNYVNGRIIRREELFLKVNHFLLLGKPIFPPKNLQSPRNRVLSKEALDLIEHGLQGKMRDLEGEFPFHLNVIYEEKEQKWFLEIAGKRFHVKGGYNALKKIRSAIKGNAIIDHKKYGWESDSTRVVRDRLAELIGDEEALQVILQVKKMGALYKVVSGNST